MAYTAGSLAQIASGANGSLIFYYDAGSDSMATVAASGYFNNSDDALNLTVDDVILAQCTDGDMWLRVSGVSSGSVTTQSMSFEGPWNGVIGSVSAAISVGITEIGTGTGSAFVLPTPYIGANVKVYLAGSASVAAERTFVTDATGVTLDGQGDRTISLNAEGQGFNITGVSTTRWAMLGGHSGAALS